jgi:hypothetical protein
VTVPHPSSTTVPGPAGGGEISTVALLRQIESGAINAKSIAVAERRQLVAFLLSDGYSAAEMGQILKVADRTIERDKKAIRESNVIARDPKLVEQMVGRLVGEAELAVQRIRKAIRDKDTSKALRVDAEHRCYQIISDVVGTMQRLGYLPTAAQKVEADLTHHVGEVPDFATMQVEVRRLRQICHQTGEDAPEATQQLRLLEHQITRADMASRVDAISATMGDQGVSNDESE